MGNQIISAYWLSNLDNTFKISSILMIALHMTLHGLSTVLGCGLEIWGSLPKTKLDALQRLQDRARTIIENAKLKDIWSFDWLSIENVIRFDRSVMAYKIINKLSPENLWGKFQQRSSQSNYEKKAL